MKWLSRLMPRMQAGASFRPDSPLEDYLPDEAWFLRSREGARSIHGMGHLTRVLFWSDVLAAQVGEPVLLEELRWAAACHDLRRENDGMDRGHGARSAEWVLAELAGVRPVVGSLEIDAIASLCRSHDSRHRIEQRLEVELAILKDADALDRARFSGHDRTDPDRLRLPASRMLLPAAQRFADATVPNHNHTMPGRQILGIGEQEVRPLALRLLAGASGRRA